ncbi:Glu/Leu/Phe/Val dehydrogenase dimerization domain-containing protein [Paenibacillus pasadenensis]|uniref:Leucine dehydrogenase n=1 Tax=Paenibacillus pasadenensis TaxID=217090 RepID=A0A2N5ND40_9BACL|nr:Glu/Leu/Phe/Val dehydrogenase dimerization domain-containing protein [Paenibacillus pasadenensis]PLT48242.1 Leucine dehydrogenase [Paenibacillus pasadenensis]
MDIFREIIQESHEQVMLCHDAPSGLKAIVVLHDTRSGPALGGCRMKRYGSEEEALRDAMRLAKGMTYKNAAYRLPYGGGKAVVWQDDGDPWKAGETDEAARTRLFQALGTQIERLGGRYVAGLDLGTTIRDMDAIRTRTKHVTDTTGTIMATDEFTAEMTAYGVYLAMRAAVKREMNLPTLHDLKVLVQGLGKVGRRLCRYLYEDGARLLVSDLNPKAEAEAIRLFGAKRVRTEHVAGTACDIYAPCAAGGVLDDRTIPRLKCRMVVGAANNQLLMERHGELLHERGILYAPDFIVNAGGIIITAGELQGLGKARLKRNVEAVGQTLLDVLDLAEERGIPASEAALRLAEERLSGG